MSRSPSTPNRGPSTPNRGPSTPNRGPSTLNRGPSPLGRSRVDTPSLLRRSRLRSTSQWGQDLAVLDLLGFRQGGFFLDSGATNGVRCNNTWLLESAFAWKGICVEPDDAAFAELVNNRTCRCFNCCLYDRPGQVDFVEAGTLGGILDQFDPTHLELAKRCHHLAGDASGKPVTVAKEARTILSILKECAAPRVIDYWSLDTEGSELTLLRSFPFDEYTFHVLSVEHNWLPVREQIKTFLESRGYRRVREMQIDDIYMKNTPGV
jgi:hypothetical protein